MSHQSELIATNIEAYLEEHKNKELLRFLTCGSVDDGKSTLIGRLLHDSKLVYEDQLAAVESASEKHGTTGEAPDLALLVDGLKAEREQGITIDVAYRYFSTKKRKFIIADTPGHEQYTRNMATGASTCDLAIILVDARHGLMPQTRRHSFIVSLLGIRHVIVAINKMDLVDYSEERFEAIRNDYAAFASKLQLPDTHFLPLSALAGDNVVEPSENMPWYNGATLMHMLENIHIASDINLIDFRFPVQSVMRPDLNFRGFMGTIASGMVRKGQRIKALPSGKESKVARIVTYDGDLEEARAPLAVTLTLEDEIDISRGDMLVQPGNLPRTENEVDAMVVWMAEDPLLAGKEYWIKQTTQMVPARALEVRYGVDVNTLHRVEQPSLALNQIGRCRFMTSRPLFLDAYRRNRATGAFIIIDRMSNATVAAGMVLDRGQGAKAYWDAQAPESLAESESPVAAMDRARRFAQTPRTLLLTGLTGSGKSTLARALERRLFDQGRAVVMLDGQNMRAGLSRDLGFDDVGRSENLRRFAEVAKLFNEAGMIVVGAFVAPTETVRKKLAEAVGPERFSLVYLSANAQVCEERDGSGLWQRARAGEIADFPGVNRAYEAPPEPSLSLDTAVLSVDESVERVMAHLEGVGALQPPDLKA